MADGETEAARRRGVASAPVLAIGVILILLAVFVIGVGALIWRGYDDTRDRTAAAASSAAQVVAANVGWIMETSRQVLLRVDSSLGDDLEALPRNAQTSLTDAISTLPGAARIYVVAADGQTRLTTDPDFQSIDIRDRDYFAAVANGAPWHVSSLLVSRINGQQIFVISKRLERHGAFAGAAMISYTSGLMQDIWRSLNLDEQSTVGLFRDDGLLVSRYPEPPGPLDLSQYVLFTDYLKAAPTGNYDAISPADGVARIVAYRRLEGTNLLAIASISRAAAFGPFQVSVLIALALAVPVALTLALVAWWIWRLLAADTRRRVELAAALEHNQMLFREIHHRVKNNLQAVISLINLQPLTPELKQEMSQRIAAMVAVHEHIYRSDQFADVDASAYIPMIVDTLVGSYGRPVELVYAVEPLVVDREHALPLGLIVNEVVSNALKYAFLDGRAARLTVTLAPAGAGKGRLTIADNGPGFTPDPDSRGMGTRLIVGLSRQVSGSFSYNNEGGAVFDLTFELVQPGSSTG